MKNRAEKTVGSPERRPEAHSSGGDAGSAADLESALPTVAELQRDSKQVDARIKLLEKDSAYFDEDSAPAKEAALKIAELRIMRTEKDVLASVRDDEKRKDIARSVIKGCGC